MEPSLPRVPASALMRFWCAKEKALASLGQPPAWGGCCQGLGCCPRPQAPALHAVEQHQGEHRQLRATCTWQHVIKAGTGFRVAQQRLWSEDYQLEWGRRGRARQSALPETPPLQASAGAATCLPILPEQGSSCQRFASHSAAVLCQIGHPFPTAPTIPVRMSPGEEVEGLPGTWPVPWLELTGTG